MMPPLFLIGIPLFENLSGQTFVYLPMPWDYFYFPIEAFVNIVPVSMPQKLKSSCFQLFDQLSALHLTPPFPFNKYIIHISDTFVNIMCIKYLFSINPYSMFIVRYSSSRHQCRELISHAASPFTSPYRQVRRALLL